MRKLLTILTVVFALCAGYAVDATAATPGKLTLLGDAFFVSMPKGMEPGQNKIGFGGGAALQVTSNLGVVAMYDYLKTDLMEGDTKLVWSTISAYGSVALFEFKRGAINGLAGLEWFDTNVAKMDTKNIDFGYGLMGVGEIGGGVGLFGTATSTMVEGTNLLEVLKVRAGLTYGF